MNMVTLFENNFRKIDKITHIKFQLNKDVSVSAGVFLYIYKECAEGHCFKQPYKSVESELG